MTAHQTSLKLSLYDAFFFSLMVGVGESYLPAFAMSLQMPEWVVGLFATMPLLFGASVQMSAPLLIHKAHSLRHWVVGTAFFQALVFLPFIYFNFYPPSNYVWVFLAAGLYWTAGFAMTPAWNLWMSQLLPSEGASDFFSKRHRILQSGILIGLVGGGYLLHSKILKEEIFWLLFVIAFVSRLLSCWFLAGHHQKEKSPGRYHISEVLEIWKLPTYKRFFLFMFCFYMAISISSPFVTPYFLGKLHLNYQSYMWSLASLLIAKIVTVRLASKMIARWSVKTVFLLGAFGMSPLPALWSVSTEFWFINSLQAVSGVFWGFLEVSLSVIFFNHITPSRKIITLTAYNFFNAFAIAIGSLLGAFLLKSIEQTFTAYYLIFALGAGLRCFVVLTYAIMVRKEKELLQDSVLIHKHTLLLGRWNPATWFSPK